MTRFILLFFYCSNCFAQAYPLEEGSFVKSLKAQGADTILLFSIKTTGRPLPAIEDSFYACYDVHYMLWKMNGKTCLQKFASCFDTRGDGAIDTALESMPLHIDSSIVHDFIGANFKPILDSHIFPYIIKGSYNGHDYYYSSTGSHFTLYRLHMYLEDTIIYLEVNADDVRRDYSIRNDDGSVREYRANANYNYNTFTPLWILMELLDRQINFLEEKKLFRLQGISR